MSESVNPITDPRRLAALRSLRLLDSPADEAFDRLTRLARTLLKCPASVVSLVDESRQFFKSCSGLPEPWATDRQTPLSYSFCKLAVQTGTPLIVNDSHLDERVKDNPSVTALGVRAYAGIPIRSKSGELLGSFCVIDGKPREWTDEQLEVLRELAASVESEIELVEISSREREHSKLLETMIEASPLAITVVEENSEVCLWNLAAEELFKWKRQEVFGRSLPVVPPERQDEYQNARELLAAGKAFRGVTSYCVDRDGNRIDVKIDAASLEEFQGRSGRTLLIFDDISEQVRTDRERERLFQDLQKERALLDALVDQLPAGLIVAEVPSGRITLANKKATELIGDDVPGDASLETLRSFRGYRADGTAYEPDEWPLFRSIQNGEVVENEEILSEGLDGISRTLLTSSTPVSCQGEPATAAIVVFTDVSRLKESEAERYRSEEKARRIVESSQDCIKILDLDGRVLSMSSGGQRLLEIDQIEDIQGKEWVGFWRNEAQVRARHALEEAKAGRAGRFRGVCETRGTKTPKWWDVHLTPIWGKDGTPEQLLSISRDITENVLAQKEREALIRREINARREADFAEEKYRNLVDGLDAIVWEANAETWEFNFVSKRAEEILGYPLDAWIGDSKFWASIIHPDDREKTVRTCRSACDQCLDHDFEYRAVTPDGDVVWLRDIVYVETDDTGAPTHLRGVMVDITAEKELEIELRERASQLTEMDKKRNEFLAILAHELRNPLAPIGNAVDLMKFCADDPRQIEDVRLILQNQVHQMVRLIDDLMDVSRITRGKINLTLAPVVIQEILQTSVDSVQPASDELGHTLSVDIDDSEPLTVLGDRVRLAQVFTNVLNNACKYTPPGGQIHVRCFARGARAFVSIKDNGIGIPENEAEQIFEMFSQIETSISKSRGGLGIGLTLVKQLVEMHHGKVRLVEDQSDPGSEFVIELPLHHQESVQPIEMVEQKTEITSYRVLVIDDLPAIAKMFGKLVTAMGHDATVAFAPEDGLKIAQEITPDVIFSDICMPGMSGYELVQKFLGMEHLRDTVFIAMTGNGQPTDIQEALAAGFHCHVTKPASMQMLKKVFHDLESLRCRDPQFVMPKHD